MQSSQQPVAAAKDVLRVALSVSKGIALKARGKPARVVAYGAAAAVAFIGAGVGYGAYTAWRALAGAVVERRQLGHKRD